MQIEEFKKNAHLFSLGHLPTEQSHPKSRNLSDLAHTHLPEAIRLIQEIDLGAIAKVLPYLPLVHEMAQDILSTIKSGHRVFLSGCGATGRLALTLESMFREMHKNSYLEDAVLGFMAGGDYALVRSVENFEDFPQYGVRHLYNLGFEEGDLLIAITEGGETPFVIGTVEGALEKSSVQPWFVYCNPKELLASTVDRSKKIIENHKVKNLCLPIGEMALSGSTRLQATTVQMLAVGAALLNDTSLIESFGAFYQETDLVPFLEPLVKWEARVYQQGNNVIYKTSTYPIAVLTDTTERSPTFSLAPFEKETETPTHYSWCYLTNPEAKDSVESWLAILHRMPIGLEWPELNGKLSQKSILEFNFSRDSLKQRAAKIAPTQQVEISLDRTPRSWYERPAIQMSTQDQTLNQMLHLESELLFHPLHEQVFVKVILNNLSLLVMGILDRYEGNVMTWVRPSNGKLIDRTLRYLSFLIEKRGLKNPGQDELLKLIFETLPQIGSNQAVIIEVLKKLA